MSDRNSLLRPLSDAVGQSIAEHINAPPLRKNQERAVWGAWLLAAGVYGAYDFLARNNISSTKLVAAFARDPQATASVVGAPFIIWCAMALFGCLWVVVGVRNTRGPLSPMGTFWSLCFVGACCYALLRGAYIDDAPVANWYLRDFYLSTLAAALMAVFVFARGAGRGSAASLVARQIKRTATRWRTGRQRKF